MLGSRAEVGNALHRSRARADNGDAFIGQPAEIALRVAAGIVVVPAAGVEGMTLEASDAGDAGQLGPVERPVGHGHKLSPDGVTPVGMNNPAPARVVPAHCAHPGLEAGVCVQVVVAGDGLAVFKDLRRVRVFVFRDVVQLFEQRQIAVRLDVAHGAWIAIPIPGCRRSRRLSQ